MQRCALVSYGSTEQDMVWRNSPCSSSVRARAGLWKHQRDQISETRGKQAVSITGVEQIAPGRILFPVIEKLQTTKWSGWNEDMFPLEDWPGPAQQMWGKALSMWKCCCCKHHIPIPGWVSGGFLDTIEGIQLWSAGRALVWSHWEHQTITSYSPLLRKTVWGQMQQHIFRSSF